MTVGLKVVETEENFKSPLMETVLPLRRRTEKQGPVFSGFTGLSSVSNIELPW